MPSNARLTATRIESAITGTIWDADLAALPRWKAWLINALRVSYAVLRDLAAGQLTMRAMSLVFTTLLSLVPLLAISFSVLKGFGVHNQVEPLLLNFLEPLGEKGVEITNRVIGFVENVEVGVLGSLSIALLFYTVISLMQKIERAFNFTWHVSHQRPLGQRFSGYLTIVVIGPVLVFSSLGITATVMSTTLVEDLAAIRPLGTLIEVATKLVPYVMVIAAFTFIYVLMPNTRVRLRSAFVGGLAAGVLWESTGWAFASFIVASTRYTAIYSAFATLIMFLIWLYLSWLILLIGASIAFYDQHPEYLTIERGEPRLSNRVKEKLAFLVAYLIGDSYYRSLPAWTSEGLAQRLRVPKGAMESVLQALEKGGLLIRTGGDPPSYLPARPLETTEVKDVLDAVRAAEEQAHLNLQRLPAEPAVEQLLERLERITAEVLGGHTLKELSLSGNPDGGPASKPPSG